jgi:hypothetical protein
VDDEIDLSQFTITLANCSSEIVVPKRGFTSPFYLIGRKLPVTNVGSGNIVAIEADNKTD